MDTIWTTWALRRAMLGTVFVHQMRSSLGVLSSPMFRHLYTGLSTTDMENVLCHPDGVGGRDPDGPHFQGPVFVLSK